ncbi:MAG: hypothetical protein HEQ22_09520 [Sphingopyxis sp.]|uniref:polyhydroxyalkanoic acid system family protein n=1 Tax=Sphingopyxis sp. TaxID=1908224 RepID=UPI003D80B5D6
MPTVRIAHNLPADEVRRRMTARADDLVKLIPGGLGRVEHRWDSEDRMLFTIHVMGKSVPASATIEPDALAIDFELPPGLGFAEPIAEGVIRQAGDKLLLGKG